MASQPGTAIPGRARDVDGGWWRENGKLCGLGRIAPYGLGGRLAIGIGASWDYCGWLANWLADYWSS